jgi:hypothetical protein
VDNVEQVRAPTAGSVVYKVSAAGAVDGPAGEAFALAATRPLTPLATPQPTIALSLNPTRPTQPGEPVTISADVANPSPDLTAESTQAMLTLPAGVELVAGDQTQGLGTLETAGSPGDRAEASWTVRGTTAGIKQLIASTSATRYGSTFRSSATAAFGVVSPPIEAVTLAPPSLSTTGGTATPAPSVSPPAPPSATRQPPELRITSAKRKGARLIVRGSVALGASGKVAARLTTRVRGRRRVAAATTFAQLRRFRLTMKIPRGARRATLTVTYRADRHFVEQTARSTVRVR